MSGICLKSISQVKTLNTRIAYSHFHLVAGSMMCDCRSMMVTEGRVTILYYYPLSAEPHFFVLRLEVQYPYASKSTQYFKELNLQ